MNKPRSHTKTQLKDKDSIPSSQEISSSLVSTEVDPTIQSKEKLTQDCWDNMGKAQKYHTVRRRKKHLI